MLSLLLLHICVGPTGSLHVHVKCSYGKIATGFIHFVQLRAVMILSFIAMCANMLGMLSLQWLNKLIAISFSVFLVPAQRHLWNATFKLILCSRVIITIFPSPVFYSVSARDRTNAKGKKSFQTFSGERSDEPLHIVQTNKSHLYNLYLLCSWYHSAKFGLAWSV